MVCWFYQWSAESTKMIEPLKICHQIGDGLLNLPMVCWVYKYDWTIVNEWFDVLWSVQSTNGLESLQEWKDEKICNGLLSLQMVCQTTQKSTSVALRSLQKMVCVDWFQMVCSVTNAKNFDHFCCISWEILEWKFFKFLKMDQNWFYPIEQASDISKIKFWSIIYACCLNETTKTIDKLTNEQPSSHFFLTDPLFLKSFQY